MKKGKLRDLDYAMATMADFVEFYGQAPQYSVRAIVFRKGCKIVAIGGVKSEKGRMVAFSEISPDVTLPKATIWRCAMVVMEMIKAINLPVWAVAEREGENTGKLIRRFGFEHQAENVDGEVFVLWPN